ncbi:MAG: TspO/MBR family protein, partial [Rhodospirillaceae bacterium]
APVWTTLYVMIAISGWLVWKKAGFRSAKSAFMTYGAQLALNLAWSILFFGLHQIGLAMVDVLLLLAAIVVNVRTFRPINQTAALLLLPYAAWVFFASLLNLGFLLLNS